jgi:hypothetical protein
MITILAGLLASKWGKYALELIIVVSLVAGFALYFEHKGRTQQKETDDQHQAAEIEKSRKEAADAKDQVVKLSTDRANAAEARSQQAKQQFTALVGQFNGLLAQSKAGRDQVSKLSDSELHGDIVSKLGIRKPGDATPGYLPQEERTLDDTLTQYPIVQQENVTLQGQVTAKSNEAQANLDLANAKQQTIDAQNAYTTLLEKDYQTIFNQHPPRYRSAACLFIWKRGKKEVVLPVKGKVTPNQ